MLILPLTLELKIYSQNSPFTFTWGNSNHFICEVLINDSFISLAREHVGAYSRYQEEAFYLGSSQHKWIWFYEQFIPSFMHKSSGIVERKSSLSFDHYGKSLMDAFVNGELRQKEEQFTSKKRLDLVILTWNVAGFSPRGNLDEWVNCEGFFEKDSGESNERLTEPDVIIFALQEMCELTKILGDPVREAEWVRYLMCQACKVYGDGYTILHKSSLVGLISLVLIKNQLASLVENPAEQQVKLGLKGFAGNKGALGFRFDLLGSSLCFINSHLASQKQNFKLRNENVVHITRNMKFSLDKSTLSLYEHDYIFWYGDLNYRLDCLSTEKIIKLITAKNFEECLSFDQLSRAKQEEGVLRQFSEGKINFLPTFKYLVGSNQHNVRRDPAWCDRILWSGNATQKAYGSVDKIRISDHKPVFAVFTILLKKKDFNKMSMVRDDICREIDEKLKQAVPKTEISESVLCFGIARMHERNLNTMSIRNTGKAVAEFDVHFEDWVEVTPRHYLMSPEECVTLKVALVLNTRFFKVFREKGEEMDRYIKISVKNGIEYFIGLQFEVIE
jgi:phosphatidylinositol-bisphosphatase